MTASSGSSSLDLLHHRLAQNAFFAALPGDLRGTVAFRSEVRRYARGDLIARELDSPDSFLLILDGSVEICRDSDEGERTVFRTLYPPAGIGYSFLAGQPHTADLVATDETVLALIPIAHLRSIFDSRPDVLYKAISRLAELVDALSTELMEQRTLPVLERVRRAVYRNADQHGELHISHEELSHFVGATRANVTRALEKLENSGAISMGRRTIRIVRD